MIKVIIGGIGSGKTLTTVKEIITRNKNCYVNFDIKYRGATRLKESHIIKETLHEKGKPKLSVNWEFWNKLIREGKQFDIYIDEAHNVLNSRRSMSTWNNLFTSWITQIRKLLGSSEQNHLYLITQRLNSLDLVVRDLCHLIIYCNKIQSTEKSTTTIIENGRIKEKKLPNTWIIKTIFFGNYCIDKFNAFIENQSELNDGKTIFLGNPFFKYYDSFSLVTFGESVYI